MDRNHRRSSYFVFPVARSVGILLTAAVCAGIAAGCGGPSEREADSEAGREPSPVKREGIDSVLLITLDTLRADHVSCYGDSPVRTPHLDGLAARGLRVANAWTTAPLTTPAHASILTGLHPPSHGVRNNGRFRLPEDVTTLAEIMKTEGRRTGAFVSAFTTTRLFGLAQGFDTYADDFGHDRRGSMRHQRPGNEVLADAVPWLERNADAPFFAWVHFFDPHTPYSPPPKFGMDHPGHPYRGEVAFTDDLVGRLVAKLEELGVSDNTLIVAVADHGEGLGDHGEQEHGVLLYEETVHVPMILAAPGVIEPGRVIERPASVVDLLPTITGLLGLPTPDETQGRDLLSETGAEARPLVAETLYPYEEFGWSALFALREGDTKYIHSTEPEIYDLVADPREGENLIDAVEGRGGRMLATLREVSQGLQRPDRLASAAGLGAEMDEGTASRLESLGYMTGGAGAAETGSDGSTPAVLPGIEGRSPRNATTDLFRLKRAGELIGRGQLEAGIGLLQKIVDNDPENPQFLLKLAQAQARAGRDGEAEAGYRRVLELHPSFFLGYLRYARFLMNHGRPAEARDLWLDLAETTPGYVGIAPRLAEAEIAAGDPKRAAKRLEEHLSAHADDALAWAQLGRARLESGAPDGAREAFRQALEIKPTQRQAAEGLVDLLVDRDQQAEALELIEGLLERAPRDPLLKGLQRRLEAAVVQG